MIVVPFVIQQVADIINVLLSKIYDLQEILQTQGIEQTILASRLPLGFKNMLIELMINNDRGANFQQALLQNMTQLVSVGSTYIKNASNLAFVVLG